MVTYRRHWLDTFLAATAFDGRTLDVGGEREGARGRFRPKAGSDWTFLNPDPSTNPDVVVSARGKLRWWVRVIRIFLRRVFPSFLLWLDGRLVARTEITTGYFLEARK